ncbi:MAG TPA: hypothetical protein VMD59_17310, partial [Acidimicrobiales bacterium]|nr:hypothetical protein [Acidimicrobiales bacterium]
MRYSNKAVYKVEDFKDGKFRLAPLPDRTWEAPEEKRVELPPAPTQTPSLVEGESLSPTSNAPPPPSPGPPPVATRSTGSTARMKKRQGEKTVKQTVDTGAEGRQQMQREPQLETAEPDTVQYGLLDDMDSWRRYQDAQSKQTPTASTVVTFQTLFKGSQREGSFEYVAQYLYESLDDHGQDRIYRMTHVLKPGANELQEDGWEERQITDEAERRDVLDTAMRLGLVEHLQLIEPDKVHALAKGAKVEKLEELYALLLVDSASFSQITGTQTLGVGFHATTGTAKQVKEDPEGEGGWGGIRRPMDARFFQNRYALHEKWNPLTSYIGQMGALYRLGKNRDNELLSTVSVATRMNPAIKFPFPKGKERHQPTNVYAVVFKKVRPTFVLQQQRGHELFQEVAAEQIPPESIIGDSRVMRYYNQGGEDEDRA